MINAIPSFICLPVYFAAQSNHKNKVFGTANNLRNKHTGNTDILITQTS